MNLTDKRVTHAIYGEGTIVDQSDSNVSVKFDTIPEIKKFAYPMAFKSFLKLLDNTTSDEMENNIRQQEEEEQLKKEKERREADINAFTREQQLKKQSAKDVYLNSFGNVPDFCNDFNSALTDEISCLKKTGSKRQKIYDGKRIEVNSRGYVYTFVTDDELNYPEGTQISIWEGETSIAGLIIGCENFTIIISTDTNLGIDVPQLQFSAEPWRLLTSLINRIDEMSNNPSEIVRTLICDGQNSIDYGNYKITTGQDEAVKMSQTQAITFVWGPPGTGKTQTLAQIALKHIEKGHRVLMLSYSNVSVDGAIMRVHSLFKKKQPGVLVRYGYPRQRDLLEHEYLTSYNLTIRNYPDLMQERQRLIAEQKRTSRIAPRYVEISKRLAEIRQLLAIEEKNCVSRAMFVATTVSKAVVDAAIYKSKFDVVIFDEASMAYIPQIVFSASLAKKHFVCMGDFRQLPPIVQSSSTSHLNADIFQYCGIVSAVESGRNHKWLCMLNTQYRMHPQIADFASTTMYGRLLKSAEGMEKQRQNIFMLSPIPNAAIGFLDVSGMMSVCTKMSDKSRVNLLSAFIAFATALEIAKTHEVGIITPYHAQSRLLNAMARDTAKAEPSLKSISCATVHQFQGSEKDVIIYDAVDCYRMTYPGTLLTSTKNNYANRLFNVALTRAKGKFIGVANISYMESKKLTKSLVFERLIENQHQKSSCLSGNELIHRSKLGECGIMQFFTLDAANYEFVQDMLSAEHEIRIDIPDKPVNDSSLSEITEGLQMLKKEGVKIYVRAENKQNLPSALKPFAIENPFVANPVAVIDKNVVWFGMPASAAEFTSNGMTLKTLHRPIIRFVGSRTAATVQGLMEMNRTTDLSNTVDTDKNGNSITDNFASYVLAYKKCPACGKPMRLQKSRKGSFFLSCTGYPNCTETASLDVDFVEQYFYMDGKLGKRCSKCNSLLEAKHGKYGLYIQCCGIGRHKYKPDEI